MHTALAWLAGLEWRRILFVSAAADGPSTTLQKTRWVCRAAVLDESVVGHGAVCAVEFGQGDVLVWNRMTHDVVGHRAPVVIEPSIPILIFDAAAARAAVCEVTIVHAEHSSLFSCAGKVKMAGRHQGHRQATQKETD
jgi:hypothetical protein